jgi:methylase of polypeptide subunit release factors
MAVASQVPRPASSIAADLPLSIASPEEFACVREFFHHSAFDDITICRILRIQDMGGFGRVRWDEVPLESLPHRQRWCIQVFLRGLPAAEPESRQVCGKEVFAALFSMGLLRPARKTPGAVVCPVWVYPVDGFVVASDPCQGSEGEPYTPPPDVVFPAIYSGTLRFLQLMPEARNGEALDLCGGSGVGALHLSRTARAAATADVTERAALFAEFNAQLNGAPVTSLCGDLYGPVRGRQFDLITAHPPFVPATGQNMVYRDGGDTGEDIIHRIVEGLPACLRPGGTCVVLCVARDTAERQFELRAWDWLGSARAEFDVVFGLEHVMSVEEVVESMRKRGQHIGEETARELLARLRSLGTRQFVYGALFLRRYPQAVNQPPARVHLTPAGRAEDFARLLAWRSHCRQAGFDGWLAHARPRLAPQLQLTVRHAVKERELAPVEFMFSVERGFQAALRLDGWVVPLLARLEGKRSVAEIIETARQANELPEGFTLGAFADLVKMMIERGYLEVDSPA